MSTEPILFFNRYTKQIETESVYGESFLRWAYEHAIGRVATQILVKRLLFSRWYGWRMSQPKSRTLIPPFIQRYGISLDEMQRKPEDFEHFNAFFARQLQPSARPIDQQPNAVVFPADGRHFVIPDLAENNGIFVKGIKFNLAELVQDDGLAKRFARGSMLISRLCPVDYHRFHFPWDGIAGEPRLIQGDLYSVSPIALRRRPSLLWENKRYITRLQTDLLGEVLSLDVGATCVGTVVPTHPVGKNVVKGQERGYFLFGGSCVITIFEPGHVVFDHDLLENSAQGREVYARMGDRAAVLREI